MSFSVHNKFIRIGMVDKREKKREGRKGRCKTTARAELVIMKEKRTDEAKAFYQQAAYRIQGGSLDVPRHVSSTRLYYSSLRQL